MNETKENRKIARGIKKLEYYDHYMTDNAQDYEEFNSFEDWLVHMLDFVECEWAQTLIELKEVKQGEY